MSPEALQTVLQFRIRPGQLRQRHHALGPQKYPTAGAQGNVAVPAEGDGKEASCFNSGFVPAYGGALLIDGHLTVFDQGDIRGGTTNIDHQRIVQAGQKTAANGACRRPGMNGLHRCLGSEGFAHEGAVAPDHHQRRINPSPLHGLPHRLHEFLQDHQKRRIEGRRCGPLYRAEFCGKVVSENHRKVADFGNGLPDSVFVLRIEGTEIAGHSQGIHLVLDLVDLGENGRHIRSLLLSPVEIMSPGKIVVAGRGKARFHAESFNEIRVVADEKQGHPFALPFCNGIGGQGGGNGDQFDGGRVFYGNPFDDFFDADGKVALGCQALS